jgi:hypothetical protein
MPRSDRCASAVEGAFVLARAENQNIRCFDSAPTAGAPLNMTLCEMSRLRLSKESPASLPGLIFSLTRVDP